MMEYKYRILEDGNGKFILQRKGWLWNVSLDVYRDFALDGFTNTKELFDSRDEAINWLNKENKRIQKQKTHHANSKIIVKCINLVPEENDK